jgi:hypothetical protein
MFGQVERDRLDGGDAERERLDADDLHGGPRALANNPG